MNLWQYVSIGLAVIIFGLGFYTFGLNAEINSLTKDVANQEILITKWESKSDKQKTAIQLQKTSQESQSTTIILLVDELDKMISLDMSKNKLHRSEVKKYKRIIEELEKEVVIIGDIELDGCKIKIMETDYENDYIGNAFSNIGS